MSIYTHAKVYSINKRLPYDTDRIFTIYENTGQSAEYLGKGLEILTVNTYLKNLKCYSVIKSLPGGLMPNFELTDTETDRLAKTLQVEWNSPRKHLAVYFGLGDGDWLPIGAASLLAPFGYPFRIHNLLDLFTDNLAAELGIGAKIGVNVVDVNYGLLSHNDVVVITGSYVEEHVTTEAPTKPITTSKEFLHTVLAESTIALKENPDRRGFIIYNAGTKPAFLRLGGDAVPSMGIYLNPGTNYEHNQDTYPFFGSVSVVCLPSDVGEVILSGLELF